MQESKTTGTTLSTHILDLSRGRPAAGVPVVLVDAAGAQLGSWLTDTDGRARLDAPLGPGVYTVGVDVGACFSGREAMFQQVRITLRLSENRHYHVPLLITPFSVTSYRGT